MGMRLDKALGISVCLLFATQLDCSSSNSGQKVDGAPGDGSPSYKDMSSSDSPDSPPSNDSNDSNDGSTDTGRDTSIESAPIGFEVGTEAAVDLLSAPDLEIRKDTAMLDLLLDVPTGGDLPAPSVEAGIDHFAGGDLPAPSIDTGIDGPGASGESQPNPCASCAANQVCIQLNDGVCSRTSGISAGCQTVSEACRTKLASSGQKSCYSLPECEAELCPLPSYRCIYASPCGNEIPEAAVYCYGA